MFPVFEIAEPFASITEVTSVPLSTMILLKAEAELPLIVLFVAPLKVTDPVLALNVPLFVQLPLTSRLIVGLKVSVPPLFIVRLKQTGGGGPASTVTVVPFSIITSSDAVGTTRLTHVFGSLQSPPVPVEVIVASVLETADLPVLFDNVFDLSSYAERPFEICCAYPFRQKNERRKREISEVKILRMGKPIAVSRFIFWGAVVFLEV